MERRRPVVLVVDDHRDVREVLRDALSSDYDVLTAVDGLTALQVFHERSVDVVLLDIRMPEPGGLEVLRRMRVTDPRIDVIFVTAVGDIATIVEGVKSGALDYITKPFDLDDVLVRVERVVRRRSIGGEAFLVTAEIGLLTALHVIVERNVSSAISLSFSAALGGAVAGRPRLIVVESPPAAKAALELVSRLRARYPDCAFLVIAPEQAVATLLRETAGLPPWAVVGGPAHLAEILERITIAMAFGADARVAMPRLRPAVVAAAEHVSRHYRERLLIEDLARAAGVSTEQLGHVFREGLGITAKEFVARFRINAACHMLGDADHKLEHIAELTGFEDASHLSRVFTRRLGMRPGEYRRRLESASVHPTPARFARRPSPSRGG